MIIKQIAQSIKNKMLYRNAIKAGLSTKIYGKCFFEGKNYIGSRSRLKNVTMGFASYVGIGVLFTNVRIGRYCSIGSNVKVIVGSHPTIGFISTHPVFYSLTPPFGESYVDRQKFCEKKLIGDPAVHCVIGNDVWIGDGVSIFEGVTIGDGAIVAANATVVKDVPPYAIVGGVPAKVIRYRFAEEQIEKLEKFKWWNKGEPWIRSSAEEFSNVEAFFDKIDEEKNE